MQEIDNARLRELLRKDPDSAVQYLYKKYFTRMAALSRTITFDNIVAKDIAQDAFVHILENRKKLSKYHKSSIENYLVRLVKYKSILYYKGYYKEDRKLDEKKLRLFYLYEMPNHESPVETEIVASEIRDELRELIKQLPRSERECLTLRMEEEMDIEDIAKHQGVKRGAVERSLTSAKKRLQKWWLAKNKPFSTIF